MDQEERDDNSSENELPIGEREPHEAFGQYWLVPVKPKTTPAKAKLQNISKKVETVVSGTRDIVEPENSAEVPLVRLPEQPITFDESMYTSTEIMNSFTDYDKTIEVVLFVADVEATRVVGAKRAKLLFRAVLSNGNDTIEIVAWDDKARETEEVVKSNEILHIQNLQAKKLDPIWNNTQMTMQLVVTPTTVFKSFGRRNVSRADSTMAIPLVPLEEAGFHIQKKIRVQGTVRATFVKTNQWTNNAPTSVYGSGAITDGTYKLPVRITNFDENCKFRRGDLVEIVGSMQREYSPVSLVVDSVDSIKEVAGEKLSEIEIMKAGLTLPLIEHKRSLVSSADASTSKKSKTD